jgi:hypothetical protein
MNNTTHYKNCLNRKRKRKLQVRKIYPKLQVNLELEDLHLDQFHDPCIQTTQIEHCAKWQCQLAG